MWTTAGSVEALPSFASSVTKMPRPPSFRYSIRSLMLLMLNVSLFLGAVVWTIRGPDAGIEKLFDGIVDLVHQSETGLMIAGTFVVMPSLFVAALTALPIVMARLGQPPYAAFHLLGYASAASMAVLWWFAAGGPQAPLVVARLALPLCVAAIALVAEIAYRRLPRPYWMVAAMGLAMAASYVDFIVVVWAWGGKH